MKDKKKEAFKKKTSFNQKDSNYILLVEAYWQNIT